MKMKRKGILLASAILGSVAIVSTGFAAWVITSPSTSTTAQGNIEVETVSDERISLTAKLEKTDFVFGSPSDMNNPKAWLKNNSDAGTEVLKTKLTVTGSKKVNNVDTPVTTGTFKVSIKVMDGESEVTEFNNLLTVDPNNEITGKTFNMGDDVTIELGWGSEFGNVNPYTYYNSFTELTVDELPVSPKPDGKKDWGYGDVKFENFDALANDAVTNIRALESLVNGLKFVVTVSYTA